MIRKTSTILGTALCISLIGVALSKTSAQQLAPGAPAPPLEIKAWYKGKPVAALEKDKTYVIEFWATWCGPCRSAMPHLSELARANRDVTFIGVGIYEDHDQDLYRKFVKEMGSDMDYNVGYSGNRDSGMAVTWMQAAGQKGIPATFIVKDHRIMWIGHPAGLDKPLAEIKAGKFDLAASKAAFDQKAKDEVSREAAKKEIADAKAAILNKEFAAAKAQIAELRKKYPSQAFLLDNLEFALSAHENPEKWATETRAKLPKDPNLNSMLAMFSMDCIRDKRLDLGKKAVGLLVEEPGDNATATLYNVAFFYNAAGDYKTAMVYIDKALESVKTNPYRNDKSFASFKKMVEDMKALLKEKLKNQGS